MPERYPNPRDKFEQQRNPFFVEIVSNSNSEISETKSMQDDGLIKSSGSSDVGSVPEVMIK